MDIEEESNPSESELLADQSQGYCKGMMAMKKFAVLAEKGPVDIPSFLMIRYGAKSGSAAHEQIRSGERDGVVLDQHDGYVLCEAMIDLNEYGGENSTPGKHVYEALSDFHGSTRDAEIWTVGLVADGIACKDQNDPEWIKFMEAPENEGRGYHELFCEEPLAQKFLHECIGIFLMSVTGEMVATNVDYAYGDKTFPPEPIFGEPLTQREGSVFDKDRDWLEKQRVVAQMVLFFAEMETDIAVQGDNTAPA